MIINGNSLEELKKFPDNYFHSAVLDPPYGLSFMGKKWDYDVPSVELWTEVFRVLKEGGHLLAFAGTRTQHRMAVNIEDAGFEIRDMIAWVYGSGFPKSHNIGKAVDKLQGNEREEIEEEHWGRKNRSYHNSSDSDMHFKYKGNNNKNIGSKIKTSIGNSEWEGWGTALKPALEPITMARKPFKTTVAENVLTNGVGGINIDGCRVEGKWNGKTRTNSPDKKQVYGDYKKIKTEQHNLGRFPANFIHDGSDEVVNNFPITKSGALNKGHKQGKGMFGKIVGDKITGNYGNDKGSASRFFYCAKASKQDRNEGLEDFEEKEATQRMNASEFRYEEGREPTPRAKQSVNKNNHPTVKPTDLMRYLVRLVTPKNGIVLDCFMGSGSTGKACALEGFEFVGIDLDKDYCEIAKARIDKAIEQKKQDEAQKELF